MRFRPGYFLLLFLCPSSVLAVPAGAPSNGDPPFQPPIDFTEMFLRVLGALLLVICILVVGAWLFRKTKIFNIYQSGPAQLRILESRSLGYRNSLMVVSYSQERFLLSVSTNGARLIAPLSEPSEAADGNAPTAFAQKLDRIQERKNS